MNFRETFLGCLFISMICGLSGCGDSKPTTKPVSQEKPAKADKHPETKNIEAVDAIGYDGKAVRGKVDKLIDKSDENNKKLEEMNELNNQ